MKPQISGLTRRDFLKLGSTGVLGLAAPGLAYSPALDPFPGDLSGRVTSRILWSYDRPSLKGKRLKLYWRDLVLPITDITINEDDVEAYNRVWYQVGPRAFVYSGSVQPVRTLLNTPVLKIPATGALAEVSVPYTDALEAPEPGAKFGYRIYYDTVHWVTAALKSSADGRTWYQVLDDKWKLFYYVPGEHLRLLPDEELAPLSPDVPPEAKRIEVHLDEQYLVAYEYDVPIMTTRVATGAVLRVGTYYTPRGAFLTYHKRATRHMAAGDITASGYDLPGVPWVMYFTESGISLHGTYWHNDFGHPRSHGCVNMTVQAAKWLFRWSIPSVPGHQEFAYGSIGTRLLIDD
jgi:lipoprotein-anchoring transpeptidase ErfK/SrfK